MQEENEFITDFFLPRADEYGTFMIRRFRLPPYYDVTFTYHKDRNAEPYYKVNVDYVTKKNNSSDYIKFKKSLVLIKFMVYFLRRFLKVVIKDQEHEIDYVAIAEQSAETRMAFVYEMKSKERRILKQES